MIEILRTDSENKDFRSLVCDLDNYLDVCDGSEHAFYDTYNKIDSIAHVVILYENNLPAGCGAFKEVNPKIAEIKRMYVKPEFRKKTYARSIITMLENWAKELNYEKCILETGKRQIEAVNFYKKNKYLSIPKYPPYTEMKNSLCFEKKLI